MEGYTNIAGSQYDFDDLDIEGRVVDEWNSDVREKNTDRYKEPKLNELTILSERVKLDNGQQADVFSIFKKNELVWYTCHVCCDTMVGISSIREHVETKTHRTNMSKPVHPRAQFVKLDPKENLALEPGEPVPPGLEEVIIKNCLIQPKLDAWNKSPLIGLEFLVELTQYALDEGVYYYCLLCDKTGSERNIFIHFTSIFHYMKYLSVYFPTAARKLQGLPNRKVKKSFGLLVTEIVADIEAKYGRMKPQSETHSNFYAPGRKLELQTLVNEGPHIREREGETFADKATAENVGKKTMELQYTPPKNEDCEIAGENKESLGSFFNKNNRISVDKKRLRSRDEDNCNSPDLQIINIQLPKSPEKKKVSRSRSLSSASTISSSSSQSRGRNHCHGRSGHNLKISSSTKSHRNWSRSRSRSRSPSYRYRRHRSPSFSRKLSPGSRHRDRSPYKKWNRSRRDSRGRSPDTYKYRGTDRYGRSREQYNNRGDKYRRNEDKDASKDNSEEKVRWEKFREDLNKIEYVKLEKLKYHEKNPEKHPQYPEEWKSFWNRRYNELQRSGVDPSKHDFKPEWISFWTKRMKELYEEELSKAKDELKKKFNLPEDSSDPAQIERGTPWKHSKRSNESPGLIDISPPTPDKKDVIADIKTTWKAFTGSDIKDIPKRPLSPWEEESKAQDIHLHTKRDIRRLSPKSRSQSPTVVANDKLLEDMPQRKSRTSSLIFVLRKLTVLEQQLGSLAPKVFEILTQSLALEKIKEDASLDLLLEEENSMFLETVREKLIALLCAGVVPRNIVNTARSAIKHIDISLYLSTKRQRAIPVETVKPNMGLPISCRNVLQYAQQPKSEPVVVPGVGQVDKAAIAQQIAAALVEQGKTNVTEGELEQLINAVVGMAEASINSAQPITTANFLHQLQSMQNTAMPIISSTSLPSTDMAVSMVTSTSQPSTQTNAVVTTNPQPPVAFGALKMLQSAYNETAKAGQDSSKPDIIEITKTEPSPVSDNELAATLEYFNKSSQENQISFINGLQATNPEMYKKIHPFIPSNILNLGSRPKRSPITIPISKAKSEPKIKPLESGRLSPFSSRQGGANPTGEDRDVIDDDVEEDKIDAKVMNEVLCKPQLSQENLETSKEYSKFDVIGGGDGENIDDDDDDDYSFEDVYKAAQEKLKQKQLNEDQSSIQSLVIQELNANKNIMKKKLERSESTIISEITNNETWKITSGGQNTFTVNESFKQNQPLKQISKSQLQHALQHSVHESLPSGVEDFSDISFHQGHHDLNPCKATGLSSTITNQEIIQRKQNLTKSFSDSSQPFYSKANSEFYNENRQYTRDSLYSSFDNPPRDPYAMPNRATYNRDSFNTPYSSEVYSGYENQVNSYENQYRYRETSYGGEYSDDRAHGRPSYSGLSNYPSSASRYHDSSYPPY